MQKDSSTGSNFYDLSYLEAQRRQVVAVAQDMLSSKRGIIEGARLLVRLRPTVTRDEFDPDFMPFVAIVSETDELPIGKERDLWASSALEEKDKIIRQVEETYREGAWAACRVIIERFSANIGIERMGMFNYLLLNVICPRCGVEVEMEAEFRFGLRDLTRYRIGDQLRWDGMGVKTPKTRPEEGNYDDDAYVVCPHCERDFWLLVSVKNDVIASATVDTSKQPYISDNDIQPQATGPTAQSRWDPIAHAEKMRKSTWDVSAFFLIDSLNALSKCTQWLSLLKSYNTPDMEHSQYFIDVREIYQSGKEVINFDYDFELIWENKSFPAKLRCHFVEKGKYEIELWLPGVIANDVADKFKDGHEGFWCAFMPPAFYD